LPEVFLGVPFCPSSPLSDPPEWEPDPLAATINALLAEERDARISSTLVKLERNAVRIYGEFKPDPAPRDHHVLATPVDAVEDCFRHSGWHGRREKVVEALRRAHERQSRIDRFVNCGAMCRAQVRDDGGAIRTVARYCRDRFCIPCQGARGRIIKRNLLRLIGNANVRFITLTLRHSPTPLASQIDRFYRSFRLLRQSREWQEHVTASAAVMELKVSSRDGLWHPHIHIVATGSYWDAKELSNLWREITGDSHRVDIRAVDDREKAVGYLTSYVSKSLDASCYVRQEMLDEAVKALRGRHMITTTGAWRGTELTAPAEDDHEWIDVGSLVELHQRAKEGDDVATRYLDMLTKHNCGEVCLPPSEQDPP
jgi:hypothetical protein